MSRDLAGSRTTPKSFFPKALLWLALLHYYTTISGFVAYCFVVARKIRVTRADFFALCGLTLLLVVHWITESLTDTVHDFRYSWGWLIFYFIFKPSIVSRKVLTATLVILSVLTIVEATLVNTVISAKMLPNFPKDVEGVIGTYSLVAGTGYQRPYSFGGSPQVGSALLVTLMALCHVQRWRLWLATLAVLSCASGTGAFALLFLLLVKYPVQMVKAALPLSFILLVGTLWFLPQVEFVQVMLVEKVGWEYVGFLADYSIEVANIVYNRMGLYEFIFGSSGFGHGGDWALLSFGEMNGLVGLLVFLLMIFSRTNRANRFPLLIILAASIHYGAIFFMPGQMIFGLLLSIGKEGLPDTAGAR